ncbi:hypothetical protein CHLRE_10g434600v5 [Chlamydomonas reinhardtii]|uniref:Ion transport domain-containing protein n=1 Tax=Chlamydomonas reinhardtii TaxID=3055 RepID=A0A2K3DA34_CHLRE|nr:uncharacterized protein CHLRE_10g434600v5 [Chlamydomonas reinhardtii]PNW77392.1 hypothetical protein CHLRE_10g434600v5 [Chlamydomonas reinhardtii]
MFSRAGATQVQPLAGADDFFGRPDMMAGNSVTHTRMPTKCNSGLLALKVPDPPQFAPSAVCAISADGKIAAVGGRDIELFLWDVDTGDLLSKIRGHDIFWVGSHDNTFFITCQEDGKVLLWDRSTMRTTVTLGEVTEGITCCHIAAENDFVVVGSSKGNLYTWDTDTGTVAHMYEAGHKGPVQFAQVYNLPSYGRCVVSCGAKDHTVVVWDLLSGEPRALIEIKELEHAKNLRYDVTRDGARVVVWCTDSVPFPNLVVVDVMSQNKISVYCHEGLVRQAVFTPNGDRIVSSGNDNKLQVWDTFSLENLVTMTGHEGSVLCCAVNEAATRVVSGGEDCAVRLWSLEDGKQLLAFQAQDEPIKTVQFSSSGQKILSCDVTGRVYVWSMHAEFLTNLMRRYADNISAVTMSNDMKLCLVGCNNGRVMLWDVERRESMWEYTHHTGRVEAAAFNSMRDMCATAGADGRIVLLFADSGKQANSFLGAEEPMMTVQFSPDDERIAGCAADGKLYLYQTAGSSRKPKAVLRSNVARILNHVWSPNSKLVAGSCSDGTMMVWNASSGGIHSVLEGAAAAATCCCFDLIGKLLAVGTVLGSTLLYNLETSELLVELKGNASPLKEVVFNQETSQLTTMCSRQAAVWDVATASKIRVFDFVMDKAGDFKSPPHPYRWAVAHNSTVLFDHESEALVLDMLTIDDPLLRSYYLADVQTIASGFNHRKLLVWSAAGSNAPDKFHTTHDAITSTHFSHDDRLVVMGTQDGNVVVYDVVHGETVEMIVGHQNGPCRCVKLSADNREVLSSGADSKVVLWDWRKRAPLRIYSGHFVSIGCCDISAQGNRVVSGDNHGMICVWEKDSGNSVQTLPLAHSKAVLSVSISADGSTIASVGADDKVSIWNVDIGIELVSLTAAMESHPLYCSFSPDGNKLAVTESNGNVMVWNVAAGCQWYMIYQAHKGKVTGCSWSADCRKFTTCGTDSVTAVWDAEGGQPLFKFNLKAGPLTSCAVSPSGLYVAAGSTTGTLSVSNLAMASRSTPEPSFLFHWLATHELKQSNFLWMRLLAMYPYLTNVQDAQGWSIALHALSRGNAEVSNLILDSLSNDCGILGLISAVPFAIATRVKIHQEETGGLFGGGGGDKAARPTSAWGGGGERSGGARPRTALGTGSMADGNKSARRASLAFLGGGKDDDGQLLGPDMRQNSNLRDVLVQKSKASFSQNLKKVAVEMVTEARDHDQMALIQNNAVALALNSKSSECVQAVLDSAASNKVSWGSYHAITDMMPSLALRYPIMCYHFLAALNLRHLGDLEVPVAVLKGLDRSVIRTAPIFTNVKNLWQGHLKLHEVKFGPQPYAHVKASMVRLPYACSIGRDSLLQTLVESDVPVKVYGTPTLRAIIKHKWRLYARRKLLVRSLIYVFYVIMFTVTGVLFSMENHALTMSQYWATAAGKAHFIIDGYIFAQTAWYAWTELSQMYAIGLSMYFKSYWNTFDTTMITLVLIIPPLHVIRLTDDAGGALAPMIAFAMILVWFKSLFYGLAFEPFGPIVNMVFQVARAIRQFCVMLFMCMCSFGVALMVLSQYSQFTTGRPEQFSRDGTQDFGRTMFTMWRGVLGQFDIAWAWGSTWQELSLIFFSGFMFLVQILLLNMLIALMREVYNRVKHTEEDVFLKGRASLIVEVETLMARKQLERYANMPPYVHLLTPVRRGDTRERSGIEARLEKLEQMLMKLQDALDQGLSGPRGQGGGGPSGPSGPVGQLITGDHGDGSNINTAGLTQEQLNLIQMQAGKLKEMEDQFPAVIRQLDRVQRSVNNQELRLEGVVTVLRDIENLLRNQQPVVIHQENRPAPRRGSILTEAELEAEVKRLLGKGEEKL